MDASGVVTVSKAIATPAPGPVMAGGKLAALQARLKVLFKTVKDIGQNNNLDAKTKKMLLQSLQAEIQMVMQRIAELENGDRKKGSAMDAVVQASAEDERHRKHMNDEQGGGLDHVLQDILGNKVDITV